ncbi:MAG: acetyl-CoA carboxylase biotin carboxyl carrier protein [bacterium]
MSDNKTNEAKVMARLQSIIEMVNKSEIDELEFEEPEFKVKIKKQPSVSIVSQQPHLPYNSPQPEEEDKTVYEAGVEIITAPMVGTCYLSPSPDKPPFIQLGGKVKKGSTLCIIEAMKLMNEIESVAQGEVVEVMVKNAQPVEFGEPLFAIKVS